MRETDRSAAGFSLVEVFVALALLITALSGVAQLLVQSAALARQARGAPVVLAATRAKVEQLRALTWTFDRAGGRLSDMRSDTALDPPASSGGTGLRNSPAGTLERDIAGWVDYLDEHARSLASAGSAGAAYVRRWAVTSLSTSPDVLALSACVSAAARRDNPRDPERVCLSTLRSRR